MEGISSAQVLISAMITPALLILASGSLIATALVRLARAVDRIRKLAETGGAPKTTRLHKQRALCAERAVQWFFSAIVCFVLAGFAIATDRFAGGSLVWLPVGVTMLGMALIVLGCAEMLRECRLATQEILSEIAAFDQT